jgi:hypothetical protein
MRIGRAPGFKLISLKEHQIWENQFRELNTHSNFNDLTFKVNFVSILVADEPESVYYVSAE